MLRTLRRRFVLSHVLPLLVVLPLMGLVLIYLLETRVLLGSLLQDLTEQARLLAEESRENEEVCADPAQARLFVDRFSPFLSARIMLFDRTGAVLASSDPAGEAGQTLDPADLARALAGETATHASYSRRAHAEIVDVLVPVTQPDGGVSGAIRLSHRLTGVYARFVRLRLLIGGAVVGGLLLGAAIGWILALNLEAPLHQIAGAVTELARGERLPSLPERGPDEVRLLVRAVNELVERLHSLEQARRQLLANLVHELGRPLAALRSAIHALLGGAAEDPALRQELLEGMDGEVGRLRRLLEDLAHLHTQVLGTLELHRQPVVLSEWLPQILAAWRQAAQDKGLAWHILIPPGLPAVRMDSDRLAQAIGNLVSNAIKYTPDGGKVSIDAGFDQKAVWIVIGDTGPGIRPEDQERIFDPFYRGRSGRRFPQGMGLGLTIARDVVAAHGGMLELDSAPGRGSRFTVRLPLRGD